MNMKSFLIAMSLMVFFRMSAIAMDIGLDLDHICNKHPDLVEKILFIVITDKKEYSDMALVSKKFHNILTRMQKNYRVLYLKRILDNVYDPRLSTDMIKAHPDHFLHYFDLTTSEGMNFFENTWGRLCIHWLQGTFDHCLNETYFRIKNTLKHENKLQQWILSENLKLWPMEDNYDESKLGVVLVHSSIIALPKNLSFMSNLDTIGLMQNNLKKIPEQFFSLTKLRYLNFEGGFIKEIPSQIQSLVNLTNLHLTNSQLEIIPDEISALINLESLYLSDNKLQTLNPKIGELFKLKSLGVQYNQLTKLPSTLSNLQNLEIVNFGGNQVEDIEEDLIPLLKGIKLVFCLGNPFLQSQDWQWLKERDAMALRGGK